MVKKILFILICIAFSSNLAIHAYAEEESYIPDEYEEIEDKIPNDTADLLPEGIFSENPDEIINAVDEISSWEYMLDVAFDILGLNIRQIIKSGAILISILIICSLINALKKSITGEGISSALTLVSAALFALSAYEMCEEPLRRALMLFDEIRLFVNTVSPVICSMYAMGGNVASAIITNYGLIVFLAILENVLIIALELIIGICMALSFAQSFIAGTNLQQLSNSIKKGFTAFIAFVMLIFTTVISTQTLLGAKSDSLSTKTAKMLASHVIPVVGSSVGESLRTAGASIEYLRSNVGVAIIIIFLIMVLPTIISIAAYRIMFIGIHSISNLLGCEKEGNTVLEISSIYGYVLAILSICSLILLFLLTLFAKCSSPMA